jgi:hypothetical protein
MFDFHGGCDLVLVNSPGFLNGLGLGIHMRTKINTWWSYIDTAVLRIGNDTFEVQGGLNTAKYWVNGVEGELKETGYLAETISGYKIWFNDVSKKSKRFRIDVGYDVIGMETFNDFVRVNVKADPKSDNFAGSNGLMGAYPTGEMVDRKGGVVTDTNAFGKEWQVLRTEPMLFHNVEGVQHPEECRMPDRTATKRRRRLGEALITEEDAARACARVSPDNERDACIFDVLATNDKDMAGSY